MTQQGKFEYKLTIGAYSSETAGQLMLKKWSIGEGRSIDNYPKADFELKMNTSSLAIANTNEVRFWRREYGEATWGACFFRGTVTRVIKKRKSDEVGIMAEGLLREVKSRSLPFIAWGNTHIVDKVYSARRNATGNYMTRLWAVLDAGLPAQVPLESVKVCWLEEMVTNGSSDSSISVYNIAAGNTRQVAQQFQAQNSTLRRFWVKGYVTAAGTQALKVSLQFDVGGAPSGIEITSYSIPSTSFGLGIGNEAWAEVDLLSTVTDPVKLVLQSGVSYWLVFSLVNADATVYQLRMAESNPSPRLRVMKTDLDATGWTWSRLQQSLFFAVDFEGNWKEMKYGYGHDYDVMGQPNSPLLIFYKTDTMIGDTSGMSNFQGCVFPMLFDYQNLIRVSYWKGKIWYQTVIESWAQSMASDLYNTLDVSITEPTTKQYCIQAENTDGFAAFELLRQYCPIYCRIYENAAGQVVLEVRDERSPTTPVWEAIYAAGAERDAHTFVCGLDSPASPDRVRIIDIESFTELLSGTDVSVIKDSLGNVISVIGSGSILSSGIGIMGGFGQILADSQAFNLSLHTQSHTTREGGQVTLSGIDQTMALEVFRHSNSLIKLTDSKLGWNAKIFAVQSVKWSGGNKSTTRLDINFIDQVLTVFTPVESPGGPTLPPGILVESGDNFSRLRGGLRSTFGSGPDGRAKTGFATRGVTDAPSSSLSLAGTTMRSTEMVIHEDPTVVHNNTKYWWIRMGTGTPPGGGSKALGAQILEVVAAYQVIGGWTYLTATIHPADVVPWRGVWPKVISEVGVAWSEDEIKTGLTAMGAYSIGVPSGTYDIFGPRPELGPSKKIFATIKVINSA